MKIKSKISPAILFSVFLTISFLLSGFRVNDEVDVIKAGTARIIITPEVMPHALNLSKVFMMIFMQVQWYLITGR